MLYLLHSTVAVGGSGSSGARHYVGYCREGNELKRLEQHRKRKSGSNLVKAFLDNGGELLLARTWRGATRKDERWIKTNGHLARFCPICKNDQSHLLDGLPWATRRPRRSSKQPSTEPRTKSGGASRPLSQTTATSQGGPSPVAQPQESGTGSGHPEPSRVKRGGTL
jgi:hypothetical protein